MIISTRLPRAVALAALLAASGLSVQAPRMPANAAAGGGNLGPAITANPPHQLALVTSGPTPLLRTTAQCATARHYYCYTPQQIRAAYNVPSAYTGAGQTIMIVDAFGDPTVQHDLHVFDQQFGLPDPVLHVFYPQGAPISDPNQFQQSLGWAGEVSLDVQWSHAIAPAATIDLVISRTNFFQDLDSAVNWAVQSGLGSVITLSFGGPESLNSAANLIGFDQIAQQAAAKHISILVSAGDDGADDLTGANTPETPASDPYVTSVGGTYTLLTPPNYDSYASEQVWNSIKEPPMVGGAPCGFQFGTTGGAISGFFPVPSYQSAVATSATVTGAYGPVSGRMDADVAYNASGCSPIYTYLGFEPPAANGFYVFAGTSEGAPQWAGIVALVNQARAQAGKGPIGFLNPDLYAQAANPTAYANDFHDVVPVGGGSNDNHVNTAGYVALTGYDVPTGLGSPNVGNLLNDLVAEP